eukprot:gnl/TRDRNA2_/TRDRNA2_190584_c0_seq1.p1 gnl/TRDRNA2_/TRDRNA2_190584_c0~~gnl/TRDRNA2_/TRDRNA2_190584_c0_seq1.p1  ORF type:complete len:378 (+),score=54.89 gnl/TRDRNA2_/TRDRNA2_190584_c0_seq1:102-1136(+)
MAASEVALAEIAAGADPERGWMWSSLDVPFLVVSDQQLVDGVAAPSSEEEHQDTGRVLSAVVDAFEEERAVLLADFEGEMTGFGGVLETAAFMPTACLDRDYLEARPCVAPSVAGLLLDLRCPVGLMLAKRIMGSTAIAKVIWGANGDLTSLCHQKLPHVLGVTSRSVVDAQLAFSPPNRRIGMARMLQRVPPQLLERLPQKESIDFDRAHAANRRALQLPLGNAEAHYAVDDLHRLEVILRTQQTPRGAYAQALAMTDQIMKGIEADPDGIEWLHVTKGWFDRKQGVQRQSTAVQLFRHILALRAKNADLGPAARFVGDLEAHIRAELAAVGVTVPADLSFAN